MIQFTAKAAPSGDYVLNLESFDANSVNKIAILSETVTIRVVDCPIEQADSDLAQ